MSKVHLLQREREAIFFGLAEGKSARAIGRELDRDHTVISREMERNKGPDGEYDPFMAERLSAEREVTANSQRARKCQGIWNYVVEKLNEDWSPEQISGRIKIDHPGWSICPEAIYLYIYDKANRNLKLWINLRRARTRRMEYHGRKPHKEIIKNRVFIDVRPEVISGRTEIGHYESDNMVGKKGSGGASATTERKSRFLFLGKQDRLTAELKKNSLVASLGRLPRWMRKSITYDNGSENAKHEEISAELSTKAYFCFPYHPYEKGMVENTIGLVRQYIPKGESFENITQADLNWIAGKLNDRPRKCLGYKTPYEVFYGEMYGAFGFRM